MSEFVPQPLHMAVLERLPDEGSMMGFHVNGKPVANLRDELNKALAEQGQPKEYYVTSEQVAAATRVLKLHGYVVDKPSTNSKGRLWQRTALGRDTAIHTGQPVGPRPASEGQAA